MHCGLQSLSKMSNIAYMSGCGYWLQFACGDQRGSTLDNDWWTGAAELVQLRLRCVELCSIVLSLSCIFPQWNDTAAIPVNSFFSSACIHPSQNSTLHTNEVLKHFWSFGVGIELHNHIMIQENKWSGIIKDKYCAIADSIMTLHCWYVEGRCALSLTPGMMGRGPGAPLGPVCSVTNDNLSLLPCRSPTIVTLLRGAPNAGHDLSTSHLTKTGSLCLHCLLHWMRCQCSCVHTVHGVL